MTVYICQISHHNNVGLWSAESEADALNALKEKSDYSLNDVFDLDEAVADDKRAAYWTDDLLDLFFWIQGHTVAYAAGAASKYLDYFEGELEDLASPIDNADPDIRRYALPGGGVYDDEEAVVTIGNMQIDVDALAEAVALSAFHAQAAKIESRNV